MRFINYFGVVRKFLSRKSPNVYIPLGLSAFKKQISLNFDQQRSKFVQAYVLFKEKNSFDSSYEEKNFNLHHIQKKTTSKNVQREYSKIQLFSAMKIWKGIVGLLFSRVF